MYIVCKLIKNGTTVHFFRFSNIEILNETIQKYTLYRNGISITSQLPNNVQAMMIYILYVESMVLYFQSNVSQLWHTKSKTNIYAIYLLFFQILAIQTRLDWPKFVFVAKNVLAIGLKIMK